MDPGDKPQDDTSRGESDNSGKSGDAERCHMRNLGAMGQRDFASLCEKMGWNAHAPDADLFGWDSLVEARVVRTFAVPAANWDCALLDACLKLAASEIEAEGIRVVLPNPLELPQRAA
jgi:hypothetical protein